MNVIVMNQLGRQGRSKKRAFTRRHYRAKLLAERKRVKKHGRRED